MKYYIIHENGDRNYFDSSLFSWIDKNYLIKEVNKLNKAIDNKEFNLSRVIGIEFENKEYIKIL